MLQGTRVKLRFNQEPHDRTCCSSRLTTRTLVPQPHVGVKLFFILHFLIIILTLCFRGRVFSLDFGAMRVCDLEFDRVRRLTTPASPLPLPTANPSPNPSCHTVWKYYCRDNFGWREYSEVRPSLRIYACLLACTIYRHEARRINSHQIDCLASVMGSIERDTHTHLNIPCGTAVPSQFQFISPNKFLYPCV